MNLQISPRMTLKRCVVGLIGALAACAALPATAQIATTYHVLNKIQLGGEGGWDYLTADGATGRVYISRGTRVDVVSTRRGGLIGSVANTPGVHGIAIAPGLNRGFTSNGGDNTVTIFNLKSLAEIRNVPVGTRPDAIAFDTVTNRVFTCNAGSNDATAIEGRTGRVAGTVALGGRPEFIAADGKGSVFINLEDKSEIVEVDARSLTLKHTWSLAPGEGPSGLAMDQGHRRLFSTCDNGLMTVVDADTGKVVATPAIGKGPDAAGFDSGPQLAFSSNGRDGTLTVIHEDTPDKYTVVQTLATAPGARTMAVDPQTHRIYLVTATPAPPPADAPTTGRRRRSYVPGSFTLIVVAP